MKTLIPRLSEQVKKKGDTRELIALDVTDHRQSRIEVDRGLRRNPCCKVTITPQGIVQHMVSDSTRCNSLV